jgi:3-phosphoshikimate 1-carboxyvinyltransferase
VSIEESSQFASALLLGATVGKWSVGVVGENAEESPYVVMTSQLIDQFQHRSGSFQIEPDASSGSYFWAAGWLHPDTNPEGTAQNISRFDAAIRHRQETEAKRFFSTQVVYWPSSRQQVDEDFPFYLPWGADPFGTISRKDLLGDSIMTAITVAALGRSPARFTDLGRLRVQECERVVALRTELTKCGAKVVEEGDTLTVYPSQLHGAEIETYNDHRMAMCFAILGLKVPGIKIKNPACVKKTFPNFFQKLAAAPPHGLGATIRDASGRQLAHEELFAD